MKNAAVRLFILIIISSYLLSTIKISAFTYDPNDNTVEVTTEIPVCVLNFTVKPEKRIPPVNNWSTYLNFEITEADHEDVLIAALEGQSNFEGKISFDVCAKGIHLKAGSYEVYVRGSSHFWREYKNVDFNAQSSFLDLSSNGSVLLAGDVGKHYDNYVNALDLYEEIRHMYTNEYYTDLNQDGQVNSLDISNNLYNFYIYGDPRTSNE